MDSEPREPSHAAPARALGARASDAEREDAVRRLREGMGEGRLTLEELSGRVERAYSASAREELDTLTADLPAPPSTGPVNVSARTRWHISLIGGVHRDGRFSQARRSASVSLIGGTHLDLREAELDGPEIEVTQVSLIGGTFLVVPDGVRVELSGVSVIGGHHVEQPEHPPPPGAPVVRVRDFSLIGGVHVSLGDSEGSGRRTKRAARRERRRRRLER